MIYSLKQDVQSLKRLCSASSSVGKTEANFLNVTNNNDEVTNSNPFFVLAWRSTKDVISQPIHAVYQLPWLHSEPTLRSQKMAIPKMIIVFQACVFLFMHEWNLCFMHRIPSQALGSWHFLVGRHLGKKKSQFFAFWLTFFCMFAAVFGRFFKKNKQ